MTHQLPPRHFTLNVPEASQVQHVQNWPHALSSHIIPSSKIPYFFQRYHYCLVSQVCKVRSIFISQNPSYHMTNQLLYSINKHLKMHTVSQALDRNTNRKKGKTIPIINFSWTDLLWFVYKELQVEKTRNCQTEQCGWIILNQKSRSEVFFFSASRCAMLIYSCHQWLHQNGY